ncbi:hypothetical protein ACFX2I_001271 [Malus domestica]
MVERGGRKQRVGDTVAMDSGEPEDHNLGPISIAEVCSPREVQSGGQIGGSRDMSRRTKSFHWVMEKNMQGVNRQLVLGYGFLGPQTLNSMGFQSPLDLGPSIRGAAINDVRQIEAVMGHSPPTLGPSAEVGQQEDIAEPDAHITHQSAVCSHMADGLRQTVKNSPPINSRVVGRNKRPMEMKPMDLALSAQKKIKKKDSGALRRDIERSRNPNGHAQCEERDRVQDGRILQASTEGGSFQGGGGWPSTAARKP